MEVKVGLDGGIILPNLGEIKLAGKSIDEIEHHKYIASKMVFGPNLKLKLRVLIHKKLTSRSIIAMPRRLPMKRKHLAPEVYSK